MEKRIWRPLSIQPPNDVVKAEIARIAAEGPRVARPQEPGVEVLQPFEGEQLRGKFQFGVV